MALSIAQFAANASWFSSGSKTVTGVNWSAGDLIVVFGAMESSSPRTLATPTATGLTFSLTSTIDPGSSNECEAGIWTATAASGASGQTITQGVDAGTLDHGLAVWVVTGGVASVAGITGSTTEAAFSRTVAAGDLVIVALADWNATNPPGKTPATGSGTATERFDVGNGSTYAVWGADWVGVSAGTFSFGPNNYTSLKVAQVGIVVTPSGGTNYTKTPADPVGVTDARAVVQAGARTVADAVGATDARTVLRTSARTQADPVGVTDTVAKGLARAPADPVGVTDARASVQALVRGPADPVGATDARAVVQALERGPADPVGITDARTVAQGRALADPVGVTDAVTVVQALARSSADPVGVTDTAGGVLSASGLTLLSTFALSSADPHSITIPGATAGLDVWLLVNTAATVATPSGWTLEASRVASMGSYVFHLPGESNAGGDIGVSLDLSGARALAAVAFESASADASVYASLVEPVNSASTTYGTDAHTFTARDEALAVYMFHGTVALPPASFDVTSFDAGFTEFADTGWAGTAGSGDEAARVVVGSAESVAMTASGVVVTLDTAQPIGSAVGFVAFNLDTGLIGVKADPVGITDARTVVQALDRSSADPVGVTDTAAAAQALARSSADPVGVTDTAVADQGRTPADQVGATDAVTAAQALERGPADPVGITDSVSANLAGGLTQVLDDPVGVTDSRTVAVAYVRTVSDSVGVADSTAQAVDYVRGPADPVGVTDTGAPQTIDIGYDLDDPVGATDARTPVQALVRGPADAVGVTDTVSADATGAAVRTPADPVGLTDTASGAQGLARTLADPVGASDAVARAQGLARVPADPVGVADARTVAQALVRGPADPVGLSDTVVAVLAGPLVFTIPDPVGLSDSVVAALVALPSASVVPWARFGPIRPPMVGVRGPRFPGAGARGGR